MRNALCHPIAPNSEPLDLRHKRHTRIDLLAHGFRKPMLYPLSYEGAYRSLREGGQSALLRHEVVGVGHGEPITKAGGDHIHELVERGM